MRSVLDDAMKTLALYEVDVDNRNWTTCPAQLKTGVDGNAT